MADKKISQLTAVSTPLAGTEVLPIVQSGATKKVTALELTGTTLDAFGNVTIPNGNLVIGTSGKGIEDSTHTTKFNFSSSKAELSGVPYMVGRTTSAPTYGVITDSRYVSPNTATDFFQVITSEADGVALIELCVAGRGQSGGYYYFKGYRYVAVTGGSSINVTTLGTDITSNNITFGITWVASNTFKITFTQTVTGVNFFGVVTAIVKAGGGGSTGAGSIISLTYL